MKEIPHFPCIEPDLAKTIVLTEERKIVEKPIDIWNNPEDYVVQYKYDGIRCLIAPNTPASVVMSAEGETTPGSFELVFQTNAQNYFDRSRIFDSNFQMFSLFAVVFKVEPFAFTKF